MINIFNLRSLDSQTYERVVMELEHFVEFLNSQGSSNTKTSYKPYRVENVQINNFDIVRIDQDDSSFNGNFIVDFDLSFNHQKYHMLFKQSENLYTVSQNIWITNQQIKGKNKYDVVIDCNINEIHHLFGDYLYFLDKNRFGCFVISEFVSLTQSNKLKYKRFDLDDKIFETKIPNSLKNQIKKKPVVLAIMYLINEIEMNTISELFELMASTDVGLAWQYLLRKQNALAIFYLNQKVN